MTFTQSYRTDLLQALANLDLTKVDQAIQWLTQARDQNRWIFTCGNGGSASTASHFVCDMLKGASYQRPRKFKIVGLADSISTLTAYSNDVAYEVVFVEQLKNLASPGDLVMAISGSGNSPNVVKALEYANSAGCRTLSITGRDGGKLAKAAQLDIRVPSPHMGRIEDGHLIVCHMLCYYFMDNAQGCC